MNQKLIVAMVKTQYTDAIIDAVKEAGGTGATIIEAKGTGMYEAKTFFGLTLEQQTDVNLFLVEESETQMILDTIYRTGHLQEAGTGIAFVVDVEHAIGLESQRERSGRNG
jgi:nitrogen regulatory protein PII